MKKLILVAFALGAAFTAAGPAAAAGGCGVGFHRGPYGGCRANGGAVVVVPRGPAVGYYHPGRGYWGGDRYYSQRYRYGNGWRYR